MSDTIHAPWTLEQVCALNDFQERGGMHPFTCGSGHHAQRNPDLRATVDGWVCPDTDCDYSQDWALAFMADPEAWPKPFPRGLTDVHPTHEPYTYGPPPTADSIVVNTTPTPAADAFPGPFQVWPLARVLREVAVGSGDWTWDEEWADLDQRHAATGYLDTLEQKIRENGITMPVLIGSDGRLWDGHHRLRIAVRLGIGYVPVEIVPRTTEGMGNASYPTEGEK